MKNILILFSISCIIYAYMDHSTNQNQPEHFIDPYALIEEGQSKLKDGDLILRLNRDPSSHFIKNYNRKDKSYSHAGIVFYENGYPYIYHILGGDENPDKKLRRDSLSRFCNPRKNDAYGIYRYDLNRMEIKNARSLIHQWYDRGIKFDNAFDYKTDDKMYCSEMISKMLSKATNNRIRISLSNLNAVEAMGFAAYAHLPLEYTSKLSVVAMDALYMNPHCQVVKKYSYAY